MGTLEQIMNSPCDLGHRPVKLAACMLRRPPVRSFMVRRLNAQPRSGVCGPDSREEIPLGAETSSSAGFGADPRGPPSVHAPLEYSRASDTYVQFWGVRGSIACPDERVSRYGGNTSCVEVRCGNHLLILDGGTGLRQLGKHLVKYGSAVEVDIFYTHCHFDHVCGLPFFAPCYLPGSRLRLWAGNLPPPSGIAEALHRMMSGPLFPTGFDSFKADVTFNDFRAGAVLAPLPGVRVRTAPLNHPGGSTGYRVEHGSSSLAYITDTEHRPGELDP